MNCHHDNYSFAQGLFTVLGALLAILGGFGAQLFKKHLDHRDEQDMLFHRAVELLQRYGAISRPSTGSEEESYATSLERKYEDISIRDDIGKLALKLKGRKLRPLALRLTRFALDEEHRGAEELYSLTREIQLKLNKRLIDEYERGSKPTQKQ